MEDSFGQGEKRVREWWSSGVCRFKPGNREEVLDRINRMNRIKAKKRVEELRTHRAWRYGQNVKDKAHRA
ncbi:MAG: hypothetical protein GXO95_05770 [Nitrospirae bacterium]|nr:hypothetical protein [Nitrospirota bacterium]